MSLVPVHVAGIGAVTAIGLNARASAAAARAGVVRFSAHTHAVDRFGEPMIVARVRRHIDRGSAANLVNDGLSAIMEALTPLQDAIRSAEIPLVLGVPAPRPGWPETLSSTLLRELLAGPKRDLLHGPGTIIAAGHAAGLMAIASAWDTMRAGRAELVLAGGLDSYLEPETLEWLDEDERLHSDPTPGGFVPGEAAAFCLLATEPAIKRLRLLPLAEVLSVAHAREAERICGSGVCTGRGLTEAMRQALAPTLGAEFRADELYCDLNGEPYRTDELGFSLTRLGDRVADRRAFLTPAQCWGDVGAASGPLFVALAASAWARGYARGPHALLTTSADGGERCAALLRAPGSAPRRAG